VRKSSKQVRFLWLACALLQLGLPGAVALADVFDDGTPASAAIPHFESHSTDSCPHAHGPDAFCQFLRAPFSVVTPMVVRLGEGRALLQPVAALGPPTVVGQVTHPQSRAPPSLS
jgi:hypothetical protein